MNRAMIRLFVVGIAAVCAGCAPASVPDEEKTTPAPRDDSSSGDVGGHQGLLVPADAKRQLSEPPKLLSDEQLRDGWIALFDGQTLFGWTANSDAEWSVKDGEIIGPGGPPGLLLTTSRFHDYELKCDVWLEPGGNSGIFLRTVTHPEKPTEGCLEFNLCDSHDSFPTGSIVGRVGVQPKVKVEGGWHTVEISVRDDQVTATIDGEQVLSARASAFVETGGGHIGLQQNGGEVRFRNVLLRPHGLEPLFDGKSLSGWRKTPGSEAVMTVEDGAVHLVGKGYLESRKTFDDFVLQFDAKLNAKDVNSGLFFRTQSSTEEAPSNGYELQLQNTVAGGDRTKPADYGEGFGTGAIFRRQRARYVNANDEEWFSVTLVADGNHFASWVNGLQVTDFTDEREPDPNPRKGRRDEAGHLSFQGHDAGTDASFRDVRIKSR